MWQDALTYAIVAGAAAWVGWTVLTPAEWRGVLRARWRRAPAGKSGGSCGDCGCDH
jgi:hypothetical protein